MSVRSEKLSFVIAIPASNESERIIDCLQAISDQVGMQQTAVGILLFLNNCTDNTRDLAETWMARASCAVRVFEQDSPSASAGWARRRAMDAAAAWLEESPGSECVLLTTDADSRVPRDWLALNADALCNGADAVAGRITYDPTETAMLSERSRRRQALEFEYEIMLAEIEARIDPSRGNPWPCHWTKSGASIAVSLDAYRRVGGMPAVTNGEDRAFLDLVRSRGLVVRYAPEIVVTTSGRTDGRARGGAADTLKRRDLEIDSPCDTRLEPLLPFLVRTLRRRLGGTGETTGVGRRERPLQPTQLPRQIRRARLVLSWLRALEARRDDSRTSGSHPPPRTPERLSMP